MQVGDTVSLRVGTPLGPSDLVGTLLARAGGTLTLRRRDGAVVEVEEGTVLAGRVVPPGPARAISVADLERVAAQGWRPLESEPLGDWTLRASGGGFTRRANSVLAVGDPGLAVGDALAVVRRWYRERGQRPMLQLAPAAAPAGLVAALDAQGWAAEAATVVMTAELAPVLRAAGDDHRAAGTVHVGDAPDDGWLSLFRQAEAPAQPEVARQLLTGHETVVFASVRDGDRCVAIARVAIDGRWAGLSCVEVVADRRRAGLGRAVSIAALREGAARGGRRVYLQVMQDNAGARAMYDAMGLTAHHDYIYRVGNVEE